MVESLSGAYIFDKGISETVVACLGIKLKIMTVDPLPHLISKSALKKV
jgi:hypothetical protein